jgi:hypothetical protein
MAPDGGRGYDFGVSKLPSEVIFLVEETLEGSFVTHALGHSIFTEVDDLDALREAVRDAGLTALAAVGGLTALATQSQIGALFNLLWGRLRNGCSRFSEPDVARASCSRGRRHLGG